MPLGFPTDAIEHCRWHIDFQRIAVLTFVSVELTAFNLNFLANMKSPSCCRALHLFIF